jgi:hypothetical protein
VTAEPQDSPEIDHDFFLVSRGAGTFYADRQDGFVVVASDHMGQWHLLAGRGLSFEKKDTP